MYRQIIYLLMSGLITGCMLGPNYHRPAAPNVPYYTNKPMKLHTPTQSFNSKADISASWWTLFHSKELNQLIEQGLRYNPDVIASKARLREMQSDFRAEAGNKLLPTLDSQFAGQRQRTTLTSEGIILTPTNNEPLPFNVTNVYNLFNASVGVMYNLDFFGADRRHIEAVGALVDYYEFQSIATYLTLTSNIVTSAITLASLQQQMIATKTILNDEEKQWQVSQSNLHYGHISSLELLDNKNVIDQSKIKLAKLQNRYYRQYHALSVLIGTVPSHASIPYLTLEHLKLPSELPLSIPSKLVEQRPDVRSAEALLHRASAEVGVATANLFPKITIAANYGYDSTILSNLFDPANKIWSYGGLVSLPLLHGGYYFAKRKAAIAAYEYACANYRRVVLKAFQNVADVLRALQMDEDLLKHQSQIEADATSRLRLTRLQYQAEKASYLTLLNAKQQYEQAHLDRINAEANRLRDTVALFHALGGGWWNARG